MIFPNLAARLMPIVLAIWAMASAAEPVQAQENGVAQKKASEDKKAPALPSLPGGFPYAPLVFNENMWEEYLERQNDYEAKLREMPQDPRARNIHVFGDGGFFMLQTYFSGPNPAFVVNGTPTAAMPAPKFNFNLNFAPVVHLGAINDDGWGVRGIWQQLDESIPIARFPSNDASGKTTVSSVPVFGVPGFTAPGPLGKSLGIVNDKANFSDHLRFTMFDAEVFKEFRLDPWTLVAAAGVRYLYLSQTYDAFRTNSGTATKTVGATTTTRKLVEDSDRVDSGHNFDGVGPMGTLELRYRVARLPLWLYGKASGAILFGHEETDSFQTTTENLQTTVKTGASSKTTTINTVNFISTSNGGDKTFYDTQFEVGVDLAIPCGRFLILLRAGVADEIIFNGGDATATGGNTGFFGMRFTAGVNY